MLETLGCRAEILTAWRAGLKPEPLLTVSEWAETHRMLGSRGSSEPGKWTNARTPYLTEIMDCLSPSSPMQRVIFMKGAQIGGTEAGSNWIGFVVQHAPGPMLAVQPTTDLAKRFSDQRIDPLIEETPALRGLVAPARSRDSGNRQLSKEFPGGLLVMTGANSAVGLRSMSARFLFLDEVDAYPGDVEGEGDPVALAFARSRNFGSRKKAFLVSTPTIAGTSRIEREYEASDQRRYFVPCPHCRAMQWLQFDQLIWERGAPRTVRYRCADCARDIPERHKTAMMADGEWRATAESDDPLTVGFHLSSLYSPVGWLSWEQIARDWEAAQGNDKAIKTFKNTVLGETWQETGDSPDHKLLHLTREPWRFGEMPSRALWITGAADVQADRVEWDVWAWGPGMTCWLIDSGLIAGAPTDARTWRDLSEVTERRYQDAGGRWFKIDAFGCDAGYMSHEVYRWASGHPRREVIFALDGRGQPAMPPLGAAKTQDIDFNGRRIGSVKLWPVGTYALKIEHYGAIRRSLGERDENGDLPRGAMHLPDNVDEEYCRQLVSEYLATVRTRSNVMKREWRVMPRTRNERLDTAVYARALAHHLTGNLTRRDWHRIAEARASDPAAVIADLAEAWTEKTGIVTEAVSPPAPVPTPKPPAASAFIPKARSGWIRPRSNWL